MMNIVNQMVRYLFKIYKDYLKVSAPFILMF